ncbi:transposase [Listeria sp. FSL L7-1485]|uniref:Transposase n=1 Tax=Listeria immobilis TaxID=2713502 RepID=A0A7X0X4I4_9LIST|nr:transposase [Listeria immobilis]MBC1534748.1 transposase [Listeria immobilis]
MFYENKDRYGSPRIAQQPYDEGIETNKRVVAVLMRGMNLCAKEVHRCCLGDGYYFHSLSSHGRLYLSTYIDLAIRIPRCYMVDSHMKKDIVVQPLQIYKGETGTKEALQ